MWRAYCRRRINECYIMGRQLCRTCTLNGHTQSSDTHTSRAAYHTHERVNIQTSNPYRSHVHKLDTHTRLCNNERAKRRRSFFSYLFIYLFIFPVVNTIWFHAFNLKLREAKLCTRRCWPDTIRAWGRGRSLGDRKEWLQHISTPEFHLCPRREKIK